MKILHLGDLHFGKRINTFSLLEDQKDINKKILDLIDGQKIEAVLIAGDVYDRTIPAEDAVSLFDDFLYELSVRKLPVMIIAGNHDSAERLSFGDRLVENMDIYLSPVYDGSVKKAVLRDAYGTINFYLLPFVKPAVVRHCFPDEPIETYTDAVQVAIKQMDVDPSQRNVLLSHQFVTGAHTDGSEDELYVGGAGNVDSSVYEVFDYTALGHIHRPQTVMQDAIRYCGSPMKFSFNEEKQSKGLTIVDIREKGNITTQILPLQPMRDFITVKGKYDEIKKGKAEVRPQDFVSVVLTDEEEVANAFGNLAVVYPNLLKIGYENRRTGNTAEADGSEIDTQLAPEELIRSFYQIRNGQEMSAEQSEYIQSLIERIWGSAE